MPLTATEAASLQEAGTVLELQAQPAQPEIPRGRLAGFRLPLIMKKPEEIGDYKLLTDCGNLQEAAEGAPRCAVFGDKSRPQICGQFAVSATPCREIRFKSGVDDAETWNNYLEST